MNESIPRHDEWTPQAFEMCNSAGYPEHVKGGETCELFGIGEHFNSFTLTHLPTGLRVSPYWGSREELKDLAFRLQHLLVDAADPERALIDRAAAERIRDKWRREHKPR